MKTKDRTEYKVIGISIVMGMLVWVIDSAVDAHFFHKGSFWGMLISDAPAFELYIRSTWLFFFIAFGIVVSGIIARNKKMTETLMEREETLRTITDTAKDAIVMMDNNGNISFWNPAAERMFGYANDEAIGKELHLILGHQKYYDFYKIGFSRFRETGEGYAVGKILELTAVRKDGTGFPIELSMSAMQISGKWYAMGIIRDITMRKKTEEEIKRHRANLEEMVKERTDRLTAINDDLEKEIAGHMQAEDALRKSEKFLSTVFDSVRDPFSIIDSQYIIVKANEAYAQMRNKKVEDLIGQRCYEVLQQRVSICDACVVEKTFMSADPCAKEKLLTFPGGLELWVEIYTYPVFDEQGKVSHVIEYTRDITDRKRVEEEKKHLIERLEYLSSTDSLTGLLNRRALIERLESEIDRAKRYSSELSLVLCDMDYFKEINDNYGHAVGDRVLQFVAEILMKSLRISDIAGRYGGDEFMLILPETPVEKAQSVAERIRFMIEGTPFQPVEGQAVKKSMSIGITCFNSDAGDINALIKWVDMALYTSKREGRNKITLSRNKC